MPLSIGIQDDEITGFNEHAKNELVNVTREYINDLLDETYRLEPLNALKKTKEHEITSTLVANANLVVRRNLGKKKIRWGVKLLKLVSSILTFLTGLFYDLDKFKNNSNYPIIFIILIAITLVVITIDFIKGE